MKTNFKRIVLVSVYTLLMGVTGRAATTGSLVLSGSVPVTTSIAVSAAGSASSLDLSTTQSDLQVATVVETCNSTGGYTVTLSSANSGALKNGNYGSVSYTAKYNGSSVSLTSSGTTVTSVSSPSSTVNTSKPLTISYTGQSAGQMFAGAYTDTITLSITAN